MIFTSLYFPLLFPLVVLLVAVLPSARMRNAVLLAGSYALYWGYMPKGALVLLALTVVSYLLARAMEAHPQHRKGIAVVGVGLVLVSLVGFKYLDFLGSALTSIFSWGGCSVSFPCLELLLPIGLSYFTFQMIAYLVDVYRGRIAAERDFLAYALLSGYYVKLTAGPLVDCRDLLGQFRERRPFDAELCYLGVRQMLWGWFLKLCVAERIAPYVNAAFGAVEMHTGTTFLLATFFYMFQIYADFAGYTLLAVGTSNCLGIRLPPNFAQPYLALNPKEFWRRWHISLTTWLTNYLYIPLGGNRRGRARQLLNIMIVFVLSGLWHGANWTFIAWGVVHGAALCLHNFWCAVVPENFRKHWLWKPFAWLGTFVLVWFAWIFFRAGTISEAFTVLHKIVFDQGILFNGDGKPNQLLGLFAIGLLLASELRERFLCRFRLLYSDNPWISASTMVVLIVFILVCAVLDASGNFIYYKF